jgi:hypothetical protein
MPYQPKPTRRPRRPGMTKEDFLSTSLTPDGYAFICGYVSDPIPAWLRYEAVEAAKKAGHVR